MATTNGATTSSTVTSTAVSAFGIANSLFDIPIFDWSDPLPIPNPLSDYVTFNYVLSLAAISDEQVANPDGTYMSGETLPLICKTAGAEPANRIETAYGKFDFFIDNLVLDSIIAFENNKNTNVGKLSFDIIEPYSMGIFMLALQQAAQDAGHKNWLGAPFLLTIDFRGNQQVGTLIKIPNLTRYIPFTMGKIEMTTTERGTVYHLTGSGLANAGLTEETSTTKSDTSIKGRTVQEVLQTGEKSLQTVINRRLQQYKDDGLVEIPDEVIILFPIDVSSEVTSDNATAKESTGTATTNTAIDATSIYNKLGVERNPITKTLVQKTEQCNALGKASMGYSLKKKADPPPGKDNVVYNTDTQIWDQAKNTYDVTEGHMQFNQDLDIPTVINQVLLLSSYPEYAMSNDAIDADGMRPMWRVETQVYTITTDANYPLTGTKPRIIVYRVIPYRSHSGKMIAPNVCPPGYDNIKQNIVKQYDYIYTGKNTEVLKFNIDLSPGFASVLPADNFTRSQDLQLLAKWALGGLSDILGWFGGFLGSIFGDLFGAAESVGVSLKGAIPSTDPGVLPTRVTGAATRSSNDGQGGGGLATTVTQAAKYFYDAMTSELNMVRLDLEILGDPFWINQSGFGNYTAKPTQYKDLNADGTVNYQNGEVDVIVNFRTPIDVNQVTGMYDFGGSTETTPVVQFSGLYQVARVESTFRQGRFVQKLQGIRRPQQENKTEASPSQLFGIDSLGDSIIGTIGNIFDKIF